MANLNKKLQITELDFDAIKTNLRSFLEQQDQFQDYDFEGSGLSILLEVLAYNTHYNAFYLNMIANEMFLDSADVRDSIVSIAKQLGYTPRSRTSSRATVNLTIVPSNPGTAPAKITIEKDTAFTTSIDSVNYTFVTSAATTVDYDPGNQNYVASNVELVEGTPLVHKYLVDLSDTTQRFVIPNSAVDTSTILVNVQDSVGSSGLTTFTLSTDVNTLTPTSTVFFLEEIENETYRIYFGDDVIGKAVQTGNLVYISYLVSSGDASNKASTFTAAQDIATYSDITVTTVNAAAGGASRETKDSVKFTAPLWYEAQNRAVTQTDFETITPTLFANIDSLSVWGGQDNVPPVYGKVFLSIKPVSGYVLTETTKQTVIDLLKDQNVVTIIPEIVDPDFVFILIDSTVHYNPNSTTLTADEIKVAAINSIRNFNTSEIGKFKKKFNYSNLVSDIDVSNPSVTHNLSTVRMQKRFIPTFGESKRYEETFNNAIEPGTLASNLFVTSQDPVINHIDGTVYQFDDDGNGNIRIFKLVNEVKVVVKTTGTIDYTTGEIVISDFIPSSISSPFTDIRLTVTPEQNDITAARNTILSIEDDDITVNTVVDVE